MRKLIRTFAVISTLLLISEVASAQVPNSQRKKPAPKKIVDKPVPPPPPPPVVKEPTMEETKAWLLEKINKFKPSVYLSTNLTAKNNCEWLLVDASFDANDRLILNVKATPASECYKDQLQQVSIDFTYIDQKRMNTVESTKRVLLFPLFGTNPFDCSYAPQSATNKASVSYYTTQVAFDKSSTYEPNLTTRMGKAMLKMAEFKSAKKEEEAY